MFLIFLTYNYYATAGRDSPLYKIVSFASTTFPCFRRPEIHVGEAYEAIWLGRDFFPRIINQDIFGGWALSPDIGPPEANTIMRSI